MEKLLQLLMITGGLGLSGLLTLPLFPYGKQENYSLALQKHPATSARARPYSLSL